MSEGQLCYHTTFGSCRVVGFEHGLVKVRWPENSSSQSFESLVEESTLQKQPSARMRVQSTDGSGRGEEV